MEEAVEGTGGELQKLLEGKVVISLSRWRLSGLPIFEAMVVERGGGSELE